MVKEGGYGFWDVYQMPVRIREFLIKELSDSIRERNNKVLEQQGQAKEHGLKDIKTIQQKMKEGDKKKPPTFATKKAPAK